MVASAPSQMVTSPTKFQNFASNRLIGVGAGNQKRSRRRRDSKNNTHIYCIPLNLMLLFYQQIGIWKFNDDLTENSIDYL
jgi:hypothetical protein